MDTITNLSDKEKLNHPYYKLMEHKGEELITILNSWSREDLINWLCWNDRNGVYRDQESLDEFNNVLSKQQCIKIIVSQIENP